MYQLLVYNIYKVFFLFWAIFYEKNIFEAKKLFSTNCLKIIVYTIYEHEFLPRFSRQHPDPLGGPFLGKNPQKKSIRKISPTGAPGLSCNLKTVIFFTLFPRITRNSIPKNVLIIFKILTYILHKLSILMLNKEKKRLFFLFTW